MECPSCMDYFDNQLKVPRNLNCGHTFCEECLVKIETQKLTFCPICRTALPKNFKGKKLPKNFIALDYVIKQQELMKKLNFCPSHTKELMRHYCITCKQLICIECIVDHSGHEFVKKEESTYILKEQADNIVSQIEKMQEQTDEIIQHSLGQLQEMKLQKIKDIESIENNFEQLVKQLLIKKAQIKKEYNEAFNFELNKVNQEQENYEKHLSLLAFTKDTVIRLSGELEQLSQKKIQGSEYSNKLDSFKRQEEELQGQTDKLQLSKIQYPQIEIKMSQADYNQMIVNLAVINHRNVLMTNKKICFFGDQNKIMQFDVATEKFRIKTLPKSNQNEFLYYSAAVTLPNGDSLITGGGSSTTVYQYITSKDDIVVKKQMLQMRKEHAAVINEQLVYVMGGYDGVSNAFLNSCEVFNISQNEWSYFTPMNISKCAFSASTVNNKWIYTFGGYDGTNRLDSIERYNIQEGYWQLLNAKLKFPLSNCACFQPDKSKVVLFGGGFSSGFSPYVEQFDIETNEWKSLPIMTEGRDLRNKVVFVEECAYAVGGLNFKAEKLHFQKKQWIQLGEYSIPDNLDSWACSLTFVPKEYNYSYNAQKSQAVLQKSGISLPSGNVHNQNLEDVNIDELLQHEKMIDDEIKEELQKIRVNQEIQNDE